MFAFLKLPDLRKIFNKGNAERHSSKRFMIFSDTQLGEVLISGSKPNLHLVNLSKTIVAS